jgi:hypothetical protein
LIFGATIESHYFSDPVSQDLGLGGQRCASTRIFKKKISDSLLSYVIARTENDWLLHAFTID